MHRKIIVLLLCSIGIFTSFQATWGFFAHQKINQMAVFTLPPEMMFFYKKNIEYITSHAIDPDKRRYVSRLEAYRHYMDLDHITIFAMVIIFSILEAYRHYMDLDHFGELPFDNIPRNWTDALAMFSDVYTITENNDTLLLFGNEVMTWQEDLLYVYSDGVDFYFKTDTITLAWNTYRDFYKKNIQRQYYQEAWTINEVWLDSLFINNGLYSSYHNGFVEDKLTEQGIVPWHLEQMYYRLRTAFDSLDTRRILRHSADFGHYIADAHVPLHTTTNYNGQLTNQVGIHAFWESRLPELFADERYDYFVGKADYVDDINSYCWEIVLASHRLVDSVLLIEQELREKFPEDQQMCMEERGSSMVRTQCKEFAETYHNRMGGMVENRMRGAIKSVGDLWYTAWVDAGQPDLRGIAGYALEELAEDAVLDKAFEKGKIKGRDH